MRVLRHAVPETRIFKEKFQTYFTVSFNNETCYRNTNSHQGTDMQCCWPAVFNEIHYEHHASGGKYQHMF